MTVSEIWIGLVGIVPAQGNETHGLVTGGAYTIVLGYALNREDFTLNVTYNLHAQGYEIYETEDVEPYSERIGKYEVTDEIRELAREVELTNEYQCGEVHPFPLKRPN